MPMTLNVGLSKKVGMPDYGSLGASCHVEVELDGSLIRDDLEKFHTHVRNAFIACRQAVQDELARHQNGADASSNGDSHANGHDGSGYGGNGSAGNGHVGNNVVSGNSGTNGNSPALSGSTHGGNGRNGNSPTSSRRNPRRATASQVRAIHAIADRQGMDLAGELRERFNADRAEDLTIANASQFIDDLKAAPNGTGDRR